MYVKTFLSPKASKWKFKARQNSCEGNLALEGGLLRLTVLELYVFDSVFKFNDKLGF